MYRISSTIERGERRRPFPQNLGDEQKLQGGELSEVMINSSCRDVNAKRIVKTGGRKWKGVRSARRSGGSARSPLRICRLSSHPVQVAVHPEGQALHQLTEGLFAFPQYHRATAGFERSS
jgi:hypothetical protein